MYVIDKHYFVAAKLVDLLLEERFNALGYYIVSNGVGRQFALDLAAEGPRTLGRDGSGRAAVGGGGRWRVLVRTVLVVEPLEHFRAAAVQLEVAELVDFETVDASVAGDDLAQLLVVCRLDQLVHQGCCGGVADSVTGHGGRGAQPDQQVRLAGARAPDQT